MILPGFLKACNGNHNNQSNTPINAKENNFENL